MTHLRQYGRSDYRRKLIRPISAKVTKRVRDEIDEIAQQEETSMSEVVRRFVELGLALYFDDDPEVTNDAMQQARFTGKAEKDPAHDLSIWEAKREDRRATRARLSRIWHELQKDPDPEGERLARTLAEKEGLDWPPRMSLREADPKFSTIMARIEELWQQNGNAGVITLRELNRHFSTFDTGDLREHLATLEREGEVVLDGELAPYQSVRIKNPAYAQA